MKRAILIAIAACVLAPTIALAQVPPVLVRQPTSGFVLQPIGQWTVRASAGPAIDSADGARVGPQLHLAVERTLTHLWSVRIQNRTLRRHYDPNVNPAPVTSATQVEVGAAMVRTINPIALARSYAGVGASFLVTSFDGIAAPRNKALGVQGFVGFEIHPKSRTWGAFGEFFMQFRKMPEELENGRVFVAQLGISFGVSLMLHRGHHAR